MQFNLCGLIQMLLPLRYELIQRREENLMDAEEVTGNVQFYVWDHVAIALHVEGGQVSSVLVLLTPHTPEDFHIRDILFV